MIEEGCPREEQCTPNPCLNDGQCVDLWSSYKCNCERPYLGETCQMSELCAEPLGGLGGGKGCGCEDVLISY